MSLITGVPVALLIFVVAFGIAPGFYVLYVVFLTLFYLVSPILKLRTWLGLYHEWQSYVLMVRLAFNDDSFFRRHVKTLDKLKTVEHEKEYDAPLKRLVRAQIQIVRNLITGGSRFIEVKDSMSLGSVVVATIFFSAYILHFAANHFEIKKVNSKVHDALAIILPLLLTEELAAGMSEVLLWAKWTKLSKMISSQFKLQYHTKDEDDDEEDDEDYDDDDLGDEDDGDDEENSNDAAAVNVTDVNELIPDDKAIEHGHELEESERAARRERLAKLNEYLHPSGRMAVGLAIKVMTRYTVCLYIMASEGSQFGNGPIFATVSTKLKLVIYLKPRQSSNKIFKFSKIAEKDQLRALATCTLTVDPIDSLQGFELDRSFYKAPKSKDKGDDDDE